MKTRPFTAFAFLVSVALLALLMPGGLKSSAAQSQQVSLATPALPAPGPVLSKVEGVAKGSEAEGPPPAPDRVRVTKALRSTPATAPARRDATRADAQNVEFVGQIGGLPYAVAVQGNYAYLGVGPRLVVLDISNPANPMVVGQTEVLPHVVRSVAVVGSYAYVAAVHSGLRIINVSDPAAPTEAGSHDMWWVALGVAVAGNYAYVATGESGLRIINVSDPAAPTETGSYDTPEYAWGVAVAGNYAYVADSWDGGLRIINVSDPAAPTETGSYDTPGRASGVAVMGNYAYVADWEGLCIINVSDPAAPTETGFYDTPRSAEGVAVAGDYAYVANGSAGLRIFNVSDPAAPSKASSYNTPGSAHGVAVAGSYAYVADGSGGLRIIDVADPTHPIELGYDTAGDARGVMVAGNYAYVANGSGLRIISISDPAAPTEAGFYDTPGFAMDVALAGNYAYVADGCRGLRIINVSDPAAPTKTGSYDTPGSAHGVAVAGNYAYLADYDEGLRIINISNPAAPSEVGFYDTPEIAWGVTVVGNYAYVANGYDGLRIINVSSPAAPTEAGSCDTPGFAVGVAVAGNYAYVADLERGLRIINVSNPAAPSEVSFYYTRGYAWRVAVVGNYAYVADDYAGLRIINVSDPAAPSEVGFYDTPGWACGVAVVGNYAYVADGDGGLIILRFTGGAEPFTGTISPVYPATHTTASSVMQGGTAYRYFRLLDASGDAVPNAIVTSSSGGPASTDAQGYFTVTTQADGLGGLGGYTVSTESVTYGGQTYFTQGEPSFGVEVIERRYVHSWECGAVRKASGGVSSGLVAYLSGEVNGGMALTLEESDPDATDDDQVTMAENYTGEAGAGFGVDFSPSIEGGLVKVQGPGSHLVGELLLRTEAGVSSTFSDPYQKAAREAQGLMLLAGIADSITGFPGQPFLANILARANITLPYDEVTVGAGVHEQVELGIDGLQLSFLVGKRDAELNAIDLNLLAATGDMTVMTGHRYYDTLVSEFCVLDLSWQSSRLATEIGPIKNLVGNYVGEDVATVQEEVFYDQNTGQVNRIELSITGEGNDLTFTDIDQNRVTTRYTIPGDQIDQAVLNAAHNLSGLIRGVASSESADLEVGNDPIIAEINGLLGNVDFAEYEITAEDGAQLNLVPEIDLEVIKIDLGAGVEFKQAR